MNPSQAERVLARLKQGPATTWQLGYELGICCVTRRIFELRRQGHQITSSEKRLSGKRIVTYSLQGHSGKDNATDSVQERTDRVVVCAECGQGAVRKPRSRPLLQGEFAFCGDTHRARYHRRRNAEL